MRAWAILLILPLVTAGCLKDFGQKVGLAPDDPDPYQMPALTAATIRPGVALGDPGFCTANFLFLDRDGATVYIGTAAHCVSRAAEDDPASSTNTDGCDPQNVPYAPGSVEVYVQGASQRAVLAYNSWFTMQRDGETSATVCGANDFALLRLHPDDARKAHPEMLGFGGPSGLATDVAPGDQVHSYGASQLLPRPEATDGRQGIILQSSAWTHTAYMLTPGVPGDSGSPVVRADGQAVGILVTVGLAPFAASNGITDVAMAMQYAHEHTGLPFSLLTAPSAAAAPGATGPA